MNKLYFLATVVLLLSCSKQEGLSIDAAIAEINAPTIQTIGGSKNDVFNAVTKTTDGGYIAIGFTQSNNGDIYLKTNDSFDFLVAKFSANNSLEWQKTFGGSKDDRATSVIETVDGGFALVGYANSADLDVATNAGSKDIWLLKLSNQGNLLWEKSFGFSGADYGTSLVETADNGFVITGVLDVSASNGQGNLKSNALQHAGGDYWLLKTNSTGILEWSTFYGGSFTDEPLGIVKTSNGNFIIAGTSDSNDFDISNTKGTYDFWVVKISSSGALIWEKNFGGTEIDEARAITSTGDGNFIIVGDTRSANKDVSKNNGAADIWVLKISTEGTLIWEKTYGGTNFDVARTVSKTQDNSFLIAGSSRSLDNGFKNVGKNDALILKIDANGKLLWQKTIGGSEIDFLYSITTLNDGSIVAVGESSSADIDITENKGFTDALIIKIQ